MKELQLKRAPSHTVFPPESPSTPTGESPSPTNAAATSHVGKILAMFIIGVFVL